MRRALALLDAVVDGAGDEEITPTEIAAVISSAREAPDLESMLERDRVRGLLAEAQDAVADGMSADHVAMILHAALEALKESARSRP